MIKGAQINLNNNDTITIDKYVFHKTCDAFPEQYDVYKGGKQVAYVRLRHGYLRVDVPECSGETIYEKEYPEDEWKGSFYTTEERFNELNNIVKVLKKYKMEKKK